jgi:uncharacterized protein YacL
MVDKHFRTLYAFAISASVTVLSIAIITIWADLYAPLKDWLKAMFTHHWIGKSVLSAALFLILGGVIGLLVSKVDENKIATALWWLVGCSIIATLAIWGFYLIETF